MSLSILLSAATFLVSWAQDRAIERKTLADRVRVEAARTLAGIDRRLEIGKAFFTEIQPVLVETSEILGHGKSIAGAGLPLEDPRRDTFRTAPPRPSGEPGNGL